MIPTVLDSEQTRDERNRGSGNEIADSGNRI